MKLEQPRQLEQVPTEEKTTSRESLGKRVLKRGRDLGIALLVTGSSLMADEALAANHKADVPKDHGKKEQLNHTMKRQQEIMTAADSLAKKYDVIVEYRQFVETTENGDFTVSESRLNEVQDSISGSHEIVIHYKNKGTGKMDTYAIGIPDKEDVTYFLDATIVRLVSPDKQFSEINLEKIPLSTEVQDYFTRYKISLSGNKILLGYNFVNMFDVKNVEFNVQGQDILNIRIFNNNGSIENHKLKAGRWVEWTNSYNNK